VPRTVAYPNREYKGRRDKSLVNQRLPNSIDDTNSDLSKLMALRIGNTRGSCAYYSCPLDQPHPGEALPGEALHYAELNPVRAGLVGLSVEAKSWIWSSAAAHCGTANADEVLETEVWPSH
jgi:hypothetical protein